MAHTPKIFQGIHIYFTKVKKPLEGFFNNLFFTSEIILIFGGFLPTIYGVIIFNFNWIRVTTTYSARQKFRTRRENKNSSKLGWKSRNNPPKGHTRNRPFVFYAISKDKICHLLSLRVESSEQVGFDSD